MDEQEPLDSARGKQPNEVQEEQSVQMEPTPLSEPPSHKKLIIGIVAGFVLVAGVAGAYFFLISKDTVEPIACTAEAKMCPDGSAVGRIGPNCEFEECPIIKTNTKKVPDPLDDITFEEDQAMNDAVEESNVPDDWKTYRNEKYGFEFKYPGTGWNVAEDSYKKSFFQLTQVDDKGSVVGITGGINVISKPISSPRNSPYEEMFTSGLRCPEIAGSRNIPSPYEDLSYVYCLTEKEVQMNVGVWKKAIECTAAAWYWEKVDINTCPHEFWIDTKSFFYIVRLNFVEPIIEGSDEEIFFDKFLKGFSFF